MSHPFKAIKLHRAAVAVCTSWGVKGPRFYLLNVLRKKFSCFPIRSSGGRSSSRTRCFHAQLIVIEDRASGTKLIQDLIDDSHVARFSPEGDKIMRLHAQTEAIENGFVFVPAEAPWLANYLAELLAFPAGRHDDQVDSTAQFLAWSAAR
jgi:predicted phage terminase large subunit-like protein